MADALSHGWADPICAETRDLIVPIPVVVADRECCAAASALPIPAIRLPTPNPTSGSAAVVDALRAVVELALGVALRSAEDGHGLAETAVPELLAGAQPVE